MGKVTTQGFRAHQVNVVVHPKERYAALGVSSPTSSVHFLGFQSITYRTL